MLGQCAYRRLKPLPQRAVAEGDLGMVGASATFA
jgi:hypothetical protein